MATYLITYDLNRTGQNYPGLFTAIKGLGSNIHPLKSVWFVRSTKTAGQIRDVLKKHIDSNDQIFVGEIDDWASYNLGSVNADWLNGK